MKLEERRRQVKCSRKLTIELLGAALRCINSNNLIIASTCILKQLLRSQLTTSSSQIDT